jgi:hypothetical protein
MNIFGSRIMAALVTVFNVLALNAVLIIVALPVVTLLLTVIDPALLFLGVPVLLLALLWRTAQFGLARAEHSQ